jgi:phospholipase/carboxylesterase
MHNDLVIQQPKQPSRLVLLFHGVGSSAQDLAPLGRALSQHLADALLVSMQAPDAVGRGWQWFSVQGVTEANRSARVSEAMPRFLQAIQRWQQHSGLDAAATTLVGFSQGAIMALEATQLLDAPAGRVVAIAGRFAQPPRVAPQHTRVHLLHGDADAVMPVRLAVEASAQLGQLQAQVTLDRFPGLGHGVDTRVLEAIVQRLDQP